MTISRNTFDPAKSYKRVRFHEDRDLLDSELNELQEISLHDEQLLWDRIFTPGSILSGLTGTVNGTQVVFTDGIVYLDGHPVRVPGATLAFPDPGVYTIYVDVFRRETTVVDDPDLVNPLTGEPTAEREKWVASLQTRDTSDDPLPQGATGRTVAPLATFDRGAGILTPVVAAVISPNDPARLSAHLGQGGLDQHPAATPSQAGFMTAVHVQDLTSVITEVTTARGGAAALVNRCDALTAATTAWCRQLAWNTNVSTLTDFEAAPLRYGVGTLPAVRGGGSLLTSYGSNAPQTWRLSMVVRTPVSVTASLPIIWHDDAIYVFQNGVLVGSQLYTGTMVPYSVELILAAEEDTVIDLLLHNAAGQACSVGIGDWITDPMVWLRAATA